VNRIVDQAKKKLATDWNDFDLGPAHWLDCATTDRSTFNSSVATWVHEMSHELTEQNCLYSTISKQKWCFDLPATCPPAKSAYVEINSSDKELEKTLRSLQELYFGERSQNTAISLFDELNAYTLSTLVSTAALKQGGKKAIYTRQGFRKAEGLPTIMVNVLAYLSRFKKSNPTQYAIVFGAGSQNLIEVKALLQRAEQVYQKWTALSTKWDHPSDPMKVVETEFWNVYQTKKNEVLQ
jgi:hypothetical protein